MRRVWSSAGARAALLASALAACGGGSTTEPGLDGDRPDAGPDTGPQGCTSDSQCSDAIDCTVDACTANGRCRHTITPALCDVGESCNPSAGCEPGRACGDDQDCEDDDACTTAERCDSASRVCTFLPLDGDGDGDAPRVCGGGDCDDGRSAVYSGADERCNTIDDDCDGRVDEVALASLCDFCERVNEAGREDMSSCYVSRESFLNDECTNAAAVASALGQCDGISYACETTAFEQCACAAGERLCGGLYGVCVDVRTDPSNCGDCSRSCGSFSTCRAGTCEPCGRAGLMCCPAPRLECESGNECSGGACRACGGEGEPCCGGSACEGNAVCETGVCRGCGEPGQRCCAGDSCRARWDASDNVCVAGRCVGCSEHGEACCAGGTWRDGCNTRQLLTCQAGRCECDAGFDHCDSACIPTGDDPENCGGCGRTCDPTSQACRGGACEPCGAVGQPCCLDVNGRPSCREGYCDGRTCLMR